MARSFRPTDAQVEAFIASAETSPRHRALIYRTIRDAGRLGMTCDEVEVALNMPHQSVSARIGELEQIGMIQITGTARYTRYRRRAVVWRAANPDTDVGDAL
jgi:hypothetical protein